MNLFISAIDTDMGKTMVTGLLAKSLLNNGFNAITAKLVQTGCQGVSDDILAHRRLMGTGLLPIDANGGTCPYLFGFPASPHLSAGLEGKRIDRLVLDDTLDALEKQYPLVLTEGAGGLMVPLTPDLLTIDYVATRKMPIVLVTSAKLGSINHTLLSLEVCKHRGVEVFAVVFNHFPKAPEAIVSESSNFIQNYLNCEFPDAVWAEIPQIDNMDELFVDDMFHPLVHKLKEHK